MSDARNLFYVKGDPPFFGTTLLKETIASTFENKEKLIDSIMTKLHTSGYIAPSTNTGVRLCLDEGIVNAIRHGNNKDPEKTVTAHLFGNDRKWGIQISDQGEGFAPEEVPDQNNEESRYLEGGRGVFLMNHYMDEVGYYHRGTLLFLTKNKAVNE